MNKPKLFLIKPASAPLAAAFLILLCLACNFQRTGNTSNLIVSNKSNPTKTPVSSDQTTRTNRTNSISENDDVEDEQIYSDDDNEEETPPSTTNDSSTGSLYIGNWYVSRPNSYGGIALNINDDGTYFWRDGLTEETFNSNWEMDGDNLILKRGYKGVDWLVKPADKSETTEDMIFISENGAGMASIFFRGTRRTK